MKRGVVLGIFIILLSYGITGCHGKGPGSDPAQKEAGKPPVAVEATKVTTMDFTDGIDVVGSLSPKFSADIKSEFTGIVTDVYVTEWVKVRKGTPLARIDTRELNIAIKRETANVEMAKANLLQAQVAGNRAEREYERLLKLKEYGLVTQQNVDDGLTEKEAAGARISAAGAQLKTAEEGLRQVQTRLSKATITSPMDGVVSLRNTNVGEYVGEMGGKPMFKVIDPRILDLTVTVPSIEMSKVKLGQPLSFLTDAIADKTFTGKVLFINPVVNESDRSVKIIAEVDNASQELKGGLYVKGRIITGKRTDILTIPRTALLTWDISAKKGDIFIINGERVTRRTVQTGSVMGDIVEVTSGVSAGDPVIVRGGFNLKDGDRVNITQVSGG